MAQAPEIRRLIDLPEVADLELKALMKPQFQEPDARSQFPEIDDCSRKIFGLTADEAEETPRPANWDDIERRPTAEQIAALADLGWDLTDKKRRPLRMFDHFNQQMWLALRGVAGQLPFVAETNEPEAWAKRLSSEASRFRRR